MRYARQALPPLIRTTIRLIRLTIISPTIIRRTPNITFVLFTSAETAAIAAKTFADTFAMLRSFPAAFRRPEILYIIY